jgi:hypothetical protein
MSPREFIQFIDGLTHNKSDLHSEDIREIRYKLTQIDPEPSHNPIDSPPYTMPKDTTAPWYPKPPSYEPYIGDPPHDGPSFICGRTK